MERAVQIETLKAPGWGFPVSADFFLSGTASGAYIVATVAQIAGGPGAAQIVRAGHLLAFPLILVCLGILIVDLGLPGRFHHMLLTLRPLSPISAGAWALGLFSALAFLSLVSSWVAPGWMPDRLALLVGMAGGLVGFFVGGYKGVLLRATAQVGWREGSLLGPLFLTASAATGLGAIALVNTFLGADLGAGWYRLGLALTFVLTVELGLLTLFVIELREQAAPLLHGRLAPAFWIAALLGTLLPLVAGTVQLSPASGIVPAAVLVGGYALRYCIVMMPEVGMNRETRP